MTSNLTFCKDLSSTAGFRDDVARLRSEYFSFAALPLVCTRYFKMIRVNYVLSLLFRRTLWFHVMEMVINHLLKV